ncbi:MAG: putative homoserine kinase type (protein kinase fold)-like protein [Neobacillus sp.]|nr:putative homoserine kinase type (protein kinase fold)-like protein [Neobacillus sp.]
MQQRRIYKSIGSSKGGEALEDLKRVCRKFMIGELLEVEDLLSGGYVNANLKIRTSKGKFVVRILLKESEKVRLQYAYSIASKLVEEGVPALLPLLTTGGLPYTRYKEFVVQTTPYVEATFFQWIPEQAFSSGKMLRQVHETLRSVKESPKPTGMYQYYQLDPSTIMNELKKDGHILPSHEGTAIDDFYRLLNHPIIDTSKLPQTIIHGDWNPYNQLYNENDEVCCFMDFDTLQRGVRVFDVAYALYFFLIQQCDENVSLQFLKGYGGLTKQEIHLLPYLIAKIGLYFGIWVDYGEFQFERNLDQLKWVISEQGRNTVKGFCIRDL